jgi:hypothetical protein
MIEQVVIGGDLSKLSPADRVRYYLQVCKSLNLNPLTKPFDYIVLNGKLTLYARKDCTDQLRKRDTVSVSGLDAQVISDVYIVKAQARIGERSDMSTGAVSIKGLSGEGLANAMMKAETKAKRRVTLSICGLGMLDESEADSVPGAQRVDVDMQTGAITHAAATQATEDLTGERPVQQTTTQADPETKLCAFHGEPMKKFTDRLNPKRTWYAHPDADAPKGWCYGRAAEAKTEPIFPDDHEGDIRPEDTDMPQTQPF